MPSQRLLLFAAVSVVPLATIATAVPALSGIAVAALVGLLIGTTIDATRSLRLLDEVSVSAEGVVRLSVGGESELSLRIEDPRLGHSRLRVALDLPAGLGTEQSEQTLTVAPGEQAGRFSWPLKAFRRGLYRVDAFRCERSSAWGLWRVRTEVALDGEVRVYPSLLEERRGLASLFLRRGQLGTHRFRQVGQGREFEKLREYQPGDGYDQIHWKASAKRGFLVTKEFQIERTQEVYVVLDHSRMSSRSRGEEPALESSLRSAMLLALATKSFDDQIGLVAFSDRVDAFLPARAGSGQIDAVRDALYRLEPERVSPDFTELATFLRLRLRRRSLLIFLTDLDDSALAEDFVRGAELLGRRHVVLVNMLRPVGVEQMFGREVDNQEELVEQLSGHLRWQRLRTLGRTLSRQGVELALLESDERVRATVDQYISVKRRQVL